MQTQECFRCTDPIEKHDSTPHYRYNGWKNHETWAVSLWIGNEESSYRYWREQAAKQKEHPSQLSQHWDKPQAACYSLTQQLKDEITKQVLACLQESAQASMASDLLYSSLCEVDWQEIAESLLEN